MEECPLWFPVSRRSTLSAGTGLIFATAKTDHQNDVSTKLLRVLDKIKTQYILQTFKLPVESGQSNDQPEPDTLEPQTGEGHSEAP